MVTRNSPGPAPVVFQTADFEQFLDRAIASKGYQAGSSNSPAVGGQFVRLRLRNPTGSGKTVFLVGVWLLSNVNNTFRLTEPVTPANAALGGTDSANVMRAGQGAAIGVATVAATQVGGLSGSLRRIGLVANTPVYVPLGVILPANSSVDADFSGTLVTDVDTYTWVWYEE